MSDADMYRRMESDNSGIADEDEDYHFDLMHCKECGSITQVDACDPLEGRACIECNCEYLKTIAVDQDADDVDDVANRFLKSSGQEPKETLIDPN